MKFFKLHKQLVIISSIFLILFIVIITAFDLFSSDSAADRKSANYDIAILSSKTLDSEYMDFACQGVENACNTLGKTYNIFNISDYNNSYDDTLEAAVNSNAAFVILPDSSYEETLYKYQAKYSKTYFLLIDGIPHNEDSSDSTINYNVMSLVYDKSEASFLAGYAAVYEGYKNISYICDNSDKQALHYCYGFLQGADYAASELNKSDVNVDIAYNSKPDEASYEVPIDTDMIATSSDNIIKKLYEDESISSVSIADCDSYDFKNENVVLAASVNLSSLIEEKILNFYNYHQKDGGSVTSKNSIDYDISLKYNTSVFNDFNETVYTRILNCVKTQEISILSDTTVPVEDLELTHISVKDNKPVINNMTNKK